MPDHELHRSRYDDELDRHPLMRVQIKEILLSGAAMSPFVLVILIVQSWVAG